MKDYIPVNEPLLCGNEKKYLAECIDSGWISSEGPFVELFEKEFAHRVGRKHGIAVSNGTAAIDAAVEALKIGKGDEVILPSFTIISCVLQIVRSGATPVFVDCNPQTWNMEVSRIEEKISPKTKAIMAVHIYGLPTDMRPIEDLCLRYGLRFIEDAAEAIGQTYFGKPCGSFGDISTVSFYPNKHITTGEGGMILTDDDELADRCRKLRNLCFLPDRRFVHEDLGWNFRMTNLQAAVGVAQLENLNAFIEKKRIIGKLYSDHLEGIPGVELPLRETVYAENLYWVFGVVLNESLGDASLITAKLAKSGIGTRPFFYPLHMQPALRQYISIGHESFPVAERLYTQGFYLPSGLALTEKQVIKSANAFKDIIVEMHK